MSDTPLDTPNFFDAVERPFLDVRVSKGVVRVGPLSFLQSLQLNREFIDINADPCLKLKTFISILSIVFSDTWKEFDASDLLIVSSAISQIHKIVPVFAWQTSKVENNKKNEIELVTLVDYDGQAIAKIVATLASKFSWTADYILNQLSYYEVMAYFQEALLLENEERKNAYYLSEVGFEKSGDSYRKVPYQDPPWMSKISGARRVPVDSKISKVSEKFQPDGVVVDLSQYAKTGEVKRYEIPTNANDVGKEIRDDSTSSETS